MKKEVKTLPQHQPGPTSPINCIYIKKGDKDSDKKEIQTPPLYFAASLTGPCLCLYRIVLVELLLDDVLWVLLVVGLIFYKTCR